MTEFNKEEIAEAFCEMMRERIPDLNDPPEQVCSERFEKRMQKLMKKETAQPWMRSHTGVRNALIAGLIVIILVLVAVPTGLSATKKPPFKVVPLEGQDKIIYEKTGTTKIEHLFMLNYIPENFEFDVSYSHVNDHESQFHYIEKGKEKGYSPYIELSQQTLEWKTTKRFDNDHFKGSIVEIDGKYVYFACYEDCYYLTWVEDGYALELDLWVIGIQYDEVIKMFKSIK